MIAKHKELIDNMHQHKLTRRNKPTKRRRNYNLRAFDMGLDFNNWCRDNERRVLKRLSPEEIKDMYSRVPTIPIDFRPIIYGGYRRLEDIPKPTYLNRLKPL